LKLALAGDTMLGRKVADAISAHHPAELVDDGVVAVAGEADLFVANLECCVSQRGERFPDPDKPFFFRAPPEAVELLLRVGVDCVTLANNHALDYGADALLDTLAYLDGAGIAHVGAGPDLTAARAPAILEANGVRLAVLGCCDHPRAYAAGASSPGVAYGFEWMADALADVDADVVLVSPHWGPNMAASPSPGIRRAAAAFRAAGATLVAGHSAHVFQGVDDGVLYDLGDFLDDYAIDAELRNDLGLLFLVDLEQDRPVRVEAVPLKLDFCHTSLAVGDDAAWIGQRFTAACKQLGSVVRAKRDRLILELHP
jgi:poly-gamma-glutamate synthesis protein (capsule biosynthesis protein)